LQGEIAKSGGNSAGAPARHEGTVEVANPKETVGHRGGDLPQPVLIAQGLGEGFGFA